MATDNFNILAQNRLMALKFINNSIVYWHCPNIFDIDQDIMLYFSDGSSQ